MLSLFKKVFLKKEKLLQQAKISCAEGSDERYQPIDVSQLKRLPLGILKKFLQYQHANIRITSAPSDKKLAVIVPYRNREQHLNVFIPHMRNYFKQAGIAADIFVVQQNDKKLFNKGMLLNIGFLLTKDRYDYFCFHDIDILPLQSNYQFVNHPCCFIHQDFPVGNFGGVVLFSKEHFVQVNGFSNQYWHWGWEDTDLRERCLIAGLTPITYMPGEYEFLFHLPSAKQTPDGHYHVESGKKKILQYLNNQRRRNRKRYLRFASGKRNYQTDGLNTVHYLLQARIASEEYTRFDVLLLAAV